MRSAAFIATLALAPWWSAWAQDVSGTLTSELQAQAQRAIERQQFGEAVPYLEELDRRFASSEEPAVIQARESIVYFLGLGQLQATKLEAAAATLRRFVQAYPEARNGIFARLFWGEALYYQGKLAEARVVFDELRARHDLSGLDAGQQLGLWDKLSDCYFAERRWAEGEAVFRALEVAARRQLDAAVADEKLTKAAAYLLQAAIAQDRLDEALAALPALSARGGGARHDLNLNLALLRGGDQLYDARRFGEALFFYQQVMSPVELEAHWSARVGELEAEQRRLEGVWLFAGRRNEVEQALGLARQRLEQIRTSIGGAVPDYTSALHFRIARCYLARGRSFEAYWAFDRLWEAERAKAKSEFAEEALYGRVKTAAATRREDRVRTAGRRYLDDATWQRFLGDIGFELVRVERAAGDLDALGRLTEEFVTRVRAEPTLTEAPKLIYLAGSTLLELEELVALDALFEPLARDYPASAFTDGALYWLGLSAIFQGDFKAALDRFGLILRDFPRGGYAEDARFRVGVCYFGLLDYGRARPELEAFVSDHPQSPLVSEAQALLGDLAAAEGRVEDALAAYRAAEDAGARLEPPNLGYINHAIFQGGKLLAANRRWEEMAAWFDSYLTRWGQQGRISDAIYELGRAQEALGRGEEMLDSYFRAILRYGNDATDHGPDLMLADYPRRHEAITGALPTEQFRQALARARAEGQTSLMLRLAYTLHAMDAADEDTPRAFADQLDAASAAVLVQIARLERRTNPELALRAAEASVARQPQSPFAEDACHLIGQLRQGAGELDGALAVYGEIAARFPGSRRTAVAWLRQGDILREQRQFAAAIERYRTVLQTREWRGASWAEANYRIGLTHYEAGEYQEAFAFFQRVYVLYQNIAEWASSAYLHSGLALERMGRTEDARRTYRELLDHEHLEDTPAAREAERRLEGTS